MTKTKMRKLIYEKKVKFSLRLPIELEFQIQE